MIQSKHGKNLRPLARLRVNSVAMTLVMRCERVETYRSSMYGYMYAVIDVVAYAHAKKGTIEVYLCSLPDLLSAVYMEQKEGVAEQARD
jgi:hypothetical protein